jgi:transposase-like protein
MPAQRDLAIARRGVRPCVVIIDKHPAYRRAVRRRTWRATHIRTVLHRARGDPTEAIERSHVPVKDRIRPMLGLRSVATGQRLPEGIELARAIRRGQFRSAPELGGTWTSRRLTGGRSHVHLAGRPTALCRLPPPGE